MGNGAFWPSCGVQSRFRYGMEIGGSLQDCRPNPEIAAQCEQ